jgi:hypothetical protein
MKLSTPAVTLFTAIATHHEVVGDCEVAFGHIDSAPLTELQSKGLLKVTMDDNTEWWSSFPPKGKKLMADLGITAKSKITDAMLDTLDCR